MTERKKDKSWRVEDPIFARNLMIFGLRSGRVAGDGWMPLDEALEKGVAEVLDVADQKRVVVKTPPNPFVVFDGEQIQGALQDRMFITSFFTRRRRRLEVPVACVESGRWSGGKSFQSAAFVAPPSVRATTQASLLSARGPLKTPEEVQDRVWRRVHEVLSLSNALSAAPTRSMSAGQAFLRDETRTYLVAPILPRPKSTYTDVTKWVGDIPVFDDQVGVMFFAGGRFLGMDVVGSPALFARIYQRLLESAALEAHILQSEGYNEELKEDHIESDLNKVLRFARSFADWERSSGVGEGIEKRKRGRKLVGKVLLDGSEIVHLSVHPKPVLT